MSVTVQLETMQIQQDCWAVLVVIFLALEICHTQPVPPAGGLSQYISYSAGNCSLILTAPHGGSSRPSNIEDRTVCSGSYRGCKLSNGTCDFSHNQEPSQNCHCSSPTCKVRYYSDSYTKDIAEALQAEIAQYSGKLPHLVVVDLQRRKLDANREINEATFGDPIAVNAWDTFHYYIEKAKHEIGQGLLFDIHGMTHTEGWTEFGYGIPKSKIDSDSYTTSTRNIYASICSMVYRICGDDANCFKDVVRQTRSLGQRLTLSVDENGNSYGYTAIPSVVNPQSGVSYNYFTGGYNIKEHGSRNCGNDGNQIDAIQIEIPKAIRFSATDRAKYATVLAKVIIAYMDDLYSGW